MATRINPCFGCKLSVGCEIRDEWSSKISRLGFRSVTFDCDKLQKELRLGRRIMVSTPHGALKATITGYGRAEYSCIVDPGQIGEEETLEGVDANIVRFRRTRHARTIVRFLDEPDAVLCSNGNPFTASGICDTRDDECRCMNDAYNEMLFGFGK